MQKILILTVTAGNCHNACAQSMKRELETRGGGQTEVKIVDLLKSYSTKRNVWVADKGYSFAAGKLLPIYNAFYDRYRKANPNKRYACPPQKTVLSTLDGLLWEIFHFQPDVIYCTHFYAAIALTDLKLVYFLPCKIIASTFDYVNSPFWEAGIGVDFLTLPNEDLVDSYLALGYRREQILTCGIPVDGRTLVPFDKAEARKKLSLAQEPFTVLVMYGGGHWGGGYQIFHTVAKALKGREAQIIMINGRNKRSFRKVERVKKKCGVRVLNLGFTKEIPLCLAGADLIVNKCGGGGCSEVLNMGLPMLVPQRLPAQEGYNLSYLRKKGVALSFRGKRQLKEQLKNIMDNPKRLQEMSRNTLPLKKNAVGDLADFILAQPNADYSGYLEMMLLYGDDFRAKRAVKRALKRADKRSRRGE